MILEFKMKHASTCEYVPFTSLVLVNNGSFWVYLFPDPNLHLLYIEILVILMIRTMPNEEPDQTVQVHSLTWFFIWPAGMFSWFMDCYISIVNADNVKGKNAHGHKIRNLVTDTIDTDRIVYFRDGCHSPSLNTSKEIRERNTSSKVREGPPRIAIPLVCS